jgi:hypothetical protein
VKNIPNERKLHQRAIKYTKWSQNIPNGHKIYQHSPFQDPPIYTESGIIGMKINHLATLLWVAADYKPQLRRCR